MGRKRDKLIELGWRGFDQAFKVYSDFQQRGQPKGDEDHVSTTAKSKPMARPENLKLELVMLGPGHAKVTYEGVGGSAELLLRSARGVVARQGLNQADGVVEMKVGEEEGTMRAELRIGDKVVARTDLIAVPELTHD